MVADTPDDPYASPDAPQNRRRPGSDAGSDTTSFADDVSQRKVETHALRDVRGLVDKLEQEQERKSTLQRGAVWLIVAVGVLCLIYVLYLAFNPDNRMSPIDLPGVSSSGDARK